MTRKAGIAAGIIGSAMACGALGLAVSGMKRSSIKRFTKKAGRALNAGGSAMQNISTMTM